MAASFTRHDPTSPASVAEAGFSTARRGYQPDEVRAFLASVSAEMRRLHARERELEAELREARRVTPAPEVELDDETVTRFVGEETLRVLHTARESASEIKLRAEEQAARVMRDAHDEANRLRQEAEVEAARRRQDATSDAEAEVALAKQQGREMVTEARSYRERVLADLDRRTNLARKQIEELMHGRERLLQVFERARLVAVDVTTELRAVDEPDELVNLAPTTGPVPLMVPTARSSQPPAATGSVAAQPPKPPVVAAVPTSPTNLTDSAEPDSSGSSDDDVTAVMERPEIEADAADETTPMVVEPVPEPSAAEADAGEADTDPSGESDTIEPDTDESDTGESDTGESATATSGTGDAGSGDADTDDSEADGSDTEPGTPVAGDASGEGSDEGPDSQDQDDADHRPTDREHQTADEAIDTADTIETGETGADDDDDERPVVAPSDGNVVSLFGGRERHTVTASSSTASSSTASSNSLSSGAAATGTATIEREVESQDPTVADGIFARLRAETSDVAVADEHDQDEHDQDKHDRPVGLADTPETDAPVTGAADTTTSDTATAEIESADAMSADAESAETDHGVDGDRDGDVVSPVFARRDEALVPLIVASARKLKRVLADEQNGALDTLRQVAAVRSLDELIADEGDHAAAYRDALDDELLTAAVAGAAELGATDSPTLRRTLDRAGALQAGNAILADRLVDPLRDRLARCIADGSGDNNDVSRRIRAVYREWKTQRIDDLLDDLLRAAFAGGLNVSVAPGTALVWTPEPGEAACPDCEDNSLAGEVVAGTPFPTGHLVAPAHPGCRCLTLPTSG